MHQKMFARAIQRMKAEGKEVSFFGLANRRSEARLPLTFPIEVSGFDRDGRFFTEQSSCFDVGEASCAFRLRSEIEEDSVVAVRSFHWQNENVLDSKPSLFQVTRMRKEGEEWIVATIRLQAEPLLSNQISDQLSDQRSDQLSNEPTGHIERAVS